MGKPYASELKQLSDTYLWTLSAPVGPLTGFVARSCSLPLISVGSGGSLTAACAAVVLHQSLGQIAKAETPLDVIQQPQHIRQSSVLFLTAGGSNPDVLGAYRTAATAEPRELAALCMSSGSPLAKLAQEFRYTHLHEFPLPSGRDGFLATNSLLSTVTLLARAYGEVCGFHGDLPPSLSAAETLESTLPHLNPLLERDTWVVLHGRWGQPAAHDLESKFTEAALGHALIADYRNFAHGRHHWLAKRAEHSAVLALVTPQDQQLAERTLALLPSTVPTATLKAETDGAAGLIHLLFQVLFLVNLVGQHRRIDPGRPSVPLFGRQIYHLRLPANQASRLTSANNSLDTVAAVERKLHSNGAVPTAPEQIAARDGECRAFLNRLANAQFGVIALDYDGTLCDTRDRFHGPSSETATELVRLLEAGLIIGIATGRGRSVGDQLRQALPERVWNQLIIGYYNCSDIACLRDGQRPDRSSTMAPVLLAVADAIRQHSYLPTQADLDCRPQQITLVPRGEQLWNAVRGMALDCLARLDVPAKVVESSHSLDIIPMSVSKTHLLDHCATLCSEVGRPTNALCIGDRGEWPGNDHALLSTPYSLSVDRVSPDSFTCWNLAPRGQRGPQAALTYLRQINVSGGVARFRTNTRGFRK